jgi:SynChlorMet cassette radical SAM/SPASM protein ScmF
MLARWKVVTLCDTPEQSDTSAEIQSPDLPKGVPPLHSLYLYLTASCNLRCRHCWITPDFSSRPEPLKAIDPKVLQDAVTEAKTLGLARVKLTGGEPMLHPQFKEILGTLTCEGLSMSLETNGTMLTKKTAHYLREETNVGFVSISIDSSVPGEHDAFRGVRGAFDAALSGLDNLVEAGYTTCQVIMSVHRGNRDRMEELARLAADHKAASVKFNPVGSIGRGIAMRERGETLDFKEYIDLSHWVNKELRPKVPIQVFMFLPQALTPLNQFWRMNGKSFNCSISTTLGILGTGEIALCGIGQAIPELVYGRLGENSIRDIWLSHPAILRLRRDLKDVRGYPGICGSCIHAKSCRTSCVANNYVYSGKLVFPQWLCNEADREGVFPQTRLRDMGSERRNSG